VVHGKDSRRFGLHVEAHAIANADQKTGVLLIFEFSTDLCDQFFRKKKKKSDLWRGAFWMGFFFFNTKAEGSICSLELYGSDTMYKT
jgi:hypothetical protein